MDLQFELPMVIYCDNYGVVDLANGWSVGGGNKHMDIRVAFIRELKEAKELIINWIPTKDNTADIFAKNEDTAAFDRHAPSLIGAITKGNTFCNQNSNWNELEKRRNGFENEWIVQLQECMSIIV